MPINNIAQTISELPAPPHRGVDVQTIFVTKQEDFQDHLQGITVVELNALVTQQNTMAGAMNSTATQVNTNANTATTQAGIATTKASEASTSASQALTSRNQAETFAQQASASAVSVDATNIVYRTGNQTIAGVKTFSSDIVGSITGNAATATKLATTRNIALSGDVTGDVNFDGTGNVNIATTIAPNSILLGTDTTGNYVAGNTAGTGITVSGTAGEGWSPTISLTNVGAAGTYRSVTTDAQGRVTAGTNPTTLAGYAITDAQTASRTTATFTTVADTWYRIATSAVGIFMNSAEFVVDWSVANNHGSIRFAAGCHYGEAAGVSLMQTNYSKFGTSGITEARIVYHATFTGNYAYVEVKFAGALTNVVVNVEMQDTIGWSLVSPSTAGSVPAGYTSYLHTFVPSAAITAGTYPKVTINQEGRVISGTTLVGADIPVLDASKITTGTLPIVRGGTGVTTSTGTGNVVLSTSPTLVTPTIGVATGTSFNSITGLATVAPLVAGTATVGTSTLTARQDHIHPVQTSVTGNAGTATKLQTARTINGVSFDGSANIIVSDSTAVKLTGNETIAGIKTFSSSPIVPTPTTTGNVITMDNIIQKTAVGIGYGTGSGGTVTQLTSKSTEVTLNKPTGTIITHPEGVIYGQIVYFNVNNSLVTDDDSIAIQTKYNDSKGLKYTVSAILANGAFVVRLTNISGITLSENVVITYTIIKGVSV